MDKTSAPPFEGAAAPNNDATLPADFGAAGVVMSIPKACLHYPVCAEFKVTLHRLIGTDTPPSKIPPIVGTSLTCSELKVPVGLR